MTDEGRRHDGIGERRISKAGTIYTRLEHLGRRPVISSNLWSSVLCAAVRSVLSCGWITGGGQRVKDFRRLGILTIDVYALLIGLNRLIVIVIIRLRSRYCILFQKILYQRGWSLIEFVIWIARCEWRIHAYRTANHFSFPLCMVEKDGRRTTDDLTAVNGKMYGESR